MAIIKVATPSAKYDVVLGAGLLKTMKRRIERALGTALPRTFFVTSEEIWQHWGAEATSSFEGATVLFVPAGEKFKRLRTVEQLLEDLASMGADRDSLVIALGGGVIGDMAGFLSAIYMRGIRYVQIPTTLLAQVDSSVGGKTGANLAAGKNLVGSFHHPALVLADVDVLKTLPARELHAGLQESVKCGVIADPRLFTYLEKNLRTIRKGNPKALSYVVERSIRVKADVVNQDEREGGLRMILNFGHTIGHAIEAATGYKQLLHGEAIGWGMIAAVRLAEERGVLAPSDARRIVKLVRAYGPLPYFSSTADKLVKLSAGDKKNRGGSRRFILPVGIGKVEIVTDVTEDEMLRAAQSMLDEVKKARS